MPAHRREASEAITRWSGEEWSGAVGMPRGACGGSDISSRDNSPAAGTRVSRRHQIASAPNSPHSLMSYRPLVPACGLRRAADAARRKPVEVAARRQLNCAGWRLALKPAQQLAGCSPRRRSHQARHGQALDHSVAARGLVSNPTPLAFVNNMVHAHGLISAPGGSTIQPSSSPTAV